MIIKKRTQNPFRVTVLITFLLPYKSKLDKEGLLGLIITGNIVYHGRENKAEGTGENWTHSLRIREWLRESTWCLSPLYEYDVVMPIKS